MRMQKTFGGQNRYYAEIEHFVNCIIFPQKGDIPLTAQISGSDLDGDIFFISYDITITKENNKGDINGSFETY